MRVGVNLCWLVPGVVGGSEEATLRTLDAVLDAAPSDVEIVIFGLTALTEAHPSLTDRFETHTAPVPGRVKPLRVLVEHTWLPVMVRRHRIDVLHDAGGTSPGRMRVPRVLTVHDIQPLELPGNFHPVKVAYLRNVLPRAIAGAARVLVPSEFVRQRIVARLGVEPAHIDVAPWPPPSPVDALPIEDVRRRLGIEGRVVLLPGITYPHKDHAVAIRAVARLAERHPDLVLVLTGGEGPAEDDVRSAIGASGLGDRVVRTGRIPAAELAALVEDATVVVVPSRYEGFGIPALEAMAAGTPVVVSDAGALPELVGDGGVVFPAGDDAQLAIELHRILDEPDHRTALADAGRSRAAEFSGRRTAVAVLAAYRSAAAAL